MSTHGMQQAQQSGARPTSQQAQHHQQQQQQQHMQQQQHHQQQQHSRHPQASMPASYYAAHSAAAMQQQQQQQQQQHHLAALYTSQRSPGIPIHAASAGTSPGPSSSNEAERPRVRTDGPGGPDVKQGARIACLDCRTAKIRCSAPTDGVVPCKRCVRHDKECIFEKHRRGRKPGKWTGTGAGDQADDAPESSRGSAAPPTPAEMHQHQQSQQQHQQPQAGPSFIPLPHPQAMPPQRVIDSVSPGGGLTPIGHVPTPPPPAQLSYAPHQQQQQQQQHATSWSPRGTMAAPPSNARAARPAFGSAGMPGAPISRASSYNSQPAPFPAYSSMLNGLPSPSLPPTNASILTSTRAWPGNISLPPQPRISSTLEHHTPGTASIPRSWLDFASPGRSLLSPSLSLNGGVAGAAHANGILPSGSPPSAAVLKRKPNDEAAKMEEPEAKRSRTDGSGGGEASHSASDGSSSDAEEVDQLDEDLVGGGQNDDVLSTPLRLLAHASDAAAASKAGEEKGSTGAATMGLVSPPLRARRIPGMLSHLRGTALDGLPTRIPPLLPGVSTLRASSSVRTHMTPPFGLGPPRQALGALGLVGRSRSYTAGEGAAAQVKLTQDAINLAAAAAAGVGQADVVLSGLVHPVPSDATPSTRDHGAWEYRAGKARARGTGGSGSAQGSVEPPSSSSLAKVESNDELHSQPSPHDVGSTGSAPRRGKTLRSMRRRSRATGDEGAESTDPADEQEAGASHPDYFSLSLFSSFLDNNEKFDPIDLGMIDLREVEKLFDVFFARINPLLNLFDPFLHSVSYVRSRSVLLMTVIVALAARLSDSPRDAELAVLMERHWREKLLPEVLLGGLKSVEIAQSFLLLANYHAPAKRLADDRSWQYLGFACRIATEIGVNRPVAPSGSLRDSEQLRRRIRNRWRTWFVCFLSDRTLSAQTGRPFTIIEDEMVMASALWHREDFALPEDVSLVCLIKLRRLIAQHSEAFNVYLTAKSEGGATTDFAGLELFRKSANADLERWRDAWCIRSADEASVQSLAMAAFLVRWRPTALLHYEHARLYLNLIVLQALEPQRDAELDAPVALDCWHSATRLIDVLLDDTGPEELEASPNQTAIMATWAALAALRLTKLDHAWVDSKAMVQRAKRLAQALGRAGRSPAHRNGAAGPYGSYLRSVLEIWLPSPKVSDAEGGSSTTTGAGAESVTAAATPSPVKDKKADVSAVHVAPNAAATLAPTSPVPLVLSDLHVPIVAQHNAGAGVADAAPPAMIPATPAMMHAGIGAPITPGTAAAVAASSSFLGLPHDFMAAADVSALSGAPPDPENIDMAFDYLTAFEGVGFPAGLWQPQATWGGNNP